MRESITIIAVNSPHHLRRFDTISAGPPIGDRQTIVKVSNRAGAHTITVKKIKWSRWRLINRIIRLWVIIKY